MRAILGFEGLVALGFADPVESPEAKALLTEAPELKFITLSTFEAARSLSSRGAAALEWVDTKQFARFAVRPEEAGNDFPTMVIAVDRSGKPPQETEHAAITRLGPRRVSAGSFLWWSRFDIIDRFAARYLDDDEPFVGWMNGSPLYEVVQGESSEIWFGEEPVLGSDGSADGVLAFFTLPVYAQHFAATFRGRRRIVSASPDDDEGSLQIVEVPDLLQRLSERQDMPPIDIVINPGAPRTMIGVVYDIEEPLVQNLAAAYRLTPGNRLVFSEPVVEWQGSGTLHWSGGSSFVERPLGRTFSLAPMAALGHNPAEMTDHELDEVVARFLDESPAKRVWADEAGRLPLTEVFIVSARDNVTKLTWVESFEGFPHALSWLIEYERMADRPRRVDGSHGCWQLGFAGSGESEREDEVGAAFGASLHSILVQSARRGYRADDVDSVVTLCNVVLKTMRVQTMGYCADLAWRLAAEDGQIKTLERQEAFPLKRGELRGWLRTIEFEPEPSQMIEIRNRLGDAAELLEPKSRLFLATAFGDWDTRGHSPLMDYSPVSISIVKALETELVEILEAFANRQEATTEVTVVSDNDRLLQAFLTSRTQRPTLGQMRHLLKSPEGELHRLWTTFVDKLPEGRELRSSRFREFLAKAASRYRNSGAHDSAISLATAEGCIREVVGTPGSAGYLATVAKAKHSARSAE
jgi:hypothetical protein